jgi:hypothetical protein
LPAALRPVPAAATKAACAAPMGSQWSKEAQC